MDQSGSNVATTRCTTQVYPAPNPPTRELDNDKRTTLQRIAETFESVRKDMATAWNKVMIHIDDKVVFDKLNAMMSVTKAAADRVIRAVLRADKKASDRLNNPQTGSGIAYRTDEGNSLPTQRPTMPESDRSWQQQQSQQMSVKRTDRRQHSLPQTQLLPTEEGNLTPIRRVYVRGEDPQPKVEVPILQQPAVRKPVVLRKTVTRQPLHELHPNGQHYTTDSEYRDPTPSPTMPPLENATANTYHILEALLPVEIRAKLSRNSPQIDEPTVAPPQVSDLSTNTPSQQNTTDMVSHSSISKPDKRSVTPCPG